MTEEILHRPHIRCNSVFCQICLGEIVFEFCYHIILIYNKYGNNIRECIGHYKNLPDSWAICKLEDIVDYEQPTAYIVNSTSYKDNYPIPVLTAGKSFIIGYTNEVEGIYSKLPCIIFDDFTTDSKLVNFPFKVKSSAIKILQVKKGIEIEFVAMFMSITRLIGDTHKRYWISEYSKLIIPVPPHAEQKRIIDAAYKAFAKLDTIMESL
ncbi:type I restriction endonuclease subunit S [Odoribacter sp. OF09-27XD]|nr:type I restriction endonuclease subunit S [Odoribacter sp. OF09-27XD]